MSGASSVYPHAPIIEPIAIINPVIISVSDEMEEGWEGCLSIPGVRGRVNRHKSVEVRFTNRHGDQEETVFEDFLARVFQHEYDHIEGVLFLSLTDPEKLVRDA